MNETCPDLQRGSDTVEQTSLPIALESFFAPIDSMNCKSKVLAKSAGVNPLVASANAILAMLDRLKTASAYHDCQQLHNNIVHEIKAFEGSSLRQDCRRDNVLLARFILCATVDDVVLNSKWGKESWAEFSLLKTFYGEMSDINQFYVLLDRLRVNAENHLDLLELIYLCLATGFEGKYRNLNDGIAILEQIVDELYEAIYACRGDNRKIMPEQEAQEKNASQMSATKKRFPMWISVLLTLVIVLGMYVGFSYLLQFAADPVYQQLLSM